MSTQRYVDKAFRADSLALIEVMNGIVDSYVAQGYRLTVRQLYYQLVARALVVNTEKSYKRVTGVVNDAKLAGLMDWEAIEDRTREFIRRSRWDSPAEFMRAAARGFHMDMWVGQESRVFAIVEKEALVGVLESACRQFDVPLLAARGYPSGTVLREFAESDLLPCLNDDQRVVVLHLGDHDPSGIDMTRDLKERLELFADGNVRLLRIALTMDQIEEQSPPPNPAKSTDSRFRAYRKEFGVESWELDALQPQYLNDLVLEHIQEYVEQSVWDKRATVVERERNKILKASVSL